MAGTQAVDERPATVHRFVIWQVLVLGTILTVPAAMTFAAPLPKIPEANIWLLLSLASAYVLAAWLSRPLRHALTWSQRLLPVFLTAALLALVYLGMLLVPGIDYSRKVLLVGSTLVLGGVIAEPVLIALRSRFFWQIVAVGCAIVALSALSSLGPSARRPDHHRSAQLIAASQELLGVTYYSGYFPRRAPATGGAIASAPDGDGYLLVTPRGEFYRFTWDASDEMAVTDLHAHVPINGEEFDVDAGTSGWSASFRVADLAVLGSGSQARIFVSHHYWKSGQKCFVVRISSHAWPLTDDPAQGAPSGWRTVFESRPCLPIELGRGSPFAGEQIGGNLEFLDERHLLITMGDHQFDGWYKPTNYVQDRRADYGKTLLVDISTGSASIFTIGHRNPQGLTIDRHGRIWSTEHGPQGGDELNLLVRGGNYGYPMQTYGTEYGSVTWPPGAKQPPDERKLIRPIFAWVPSIGISEVVSVTDPAFAKWQDDLLVASLRARALWRVRVEQHRVVYAEPIPLGERLRDLVAGRGEFVLWTDSDTIIRVRPSESLMDGAVLYTSLCGGCHRENENRIGPTLKGLIGRRIASAPGYKYSDGFERLSGHWTEQRLDRFLADPKSFAPGTTMNIDAVRDAESRRKLVEYIRKFY